MTPEDVTNRFDYHVPNDERRAQHERVRANLVGVAADLNTFLPEGREKSLSITRLEEAMFWANAAIARQA